MDDKRKQGLKVMLIKLRDAKINENKQFTKLIKSNVDLITVLNTEIEKTDDD